MSKPRVDDRCPQCGRRDWLGHDGSCPTLRDDYAKPSAPPKAEVREWLYGAEFWVSEDHFFKTGNECLEAFPNAGPACGVVSTSAYLSLEAELAELKQTLRYRDEDIPVLRKTIGDLREELEQVKAELKACEYKLTCYRLDGPIHTEICERNAALIELEIARERVKGLVEAMTLIEKTPPVTNTEKQIQKCASEALLKYKGDAPMSI